MEEKKIKIEYVSHNEIVLHNERGDTFTFNPRVYEEFADFLS